MPYSRGATSTPSQPVLVQDEGVDLARRQTLNFAGAGVTVTDSGGKTLVTIPGGSGSGLTGVVDLNDYITDFTGATDQHSNIMSAVAALPSSGGALWHPGGHIRSNTEIDLSGIFTHFIGPVGGLDAQTGVGAWFRPGTPGQKLFKYDPGSLVQTGPQFTNIGLEDTQGSCTLLYVRDTNRINLETVTFVGNGGPGAHTTIGLQIDVTPGQGRDCSYHYFRNANFHSCFRGLQALRTAGFTMNGGLFNSGSDSIGMDLQNGANIFISNVSAACGNPAFNIVGGAGQTHWSNCYWESPGSTDTVSAWNFDSDGVSVDGYGHTLIGCHITGPGAGSSTATGLTFSANTHKCYAVVRSKLCQAGNIINLSTDNDIYMIGDGWLTPMRWALDATASTVGPIFTTNAGTPEGAVAAPVGSFCTDRTNGTAYVKKTGIGNTGWKLVTQAA